METSSTFSWDGVQLYTMCSSIVKDVSRGSGVIVMRKESEQIERLKTNRASLCFNYLDDNIAFVIRTIS